MRLLKVPIAHGRRRFVTNCSPPIFSIYPYRRQLLLPYLDYPNISYIALHCRGILFPRFYPHCPLSPHYFPLPFPASGSTHTLEAKKQANHSLFLLLILAFIFFSLLPLLLLPSLAHSSFFSSSSSAPYHYYYYSSIEFPVPPWRTAPHIRRPAPVTTDRAGFVSCLCVGPLHWASTKKRSLT